MANSTLRELRKHFESDDPFMSSGHQIIKPLRRRKKKPTWVSDNERIQQILLRSFPNLQTNPTQRFRAGRWALLIHLYFQEGRSRGYISEEMKWSYEGVNGAIRSIKRAALGFRPNGQGRFSNFKGRPRKKRSRLGTAIRSTP